MDIESLGGLTGTAPNASQARLAENFEMFLTLLTAQMRNQDPLNPLDSTQFVNQLVNFSSVEQQIAANQHLQNLLMIQSASAQGAAVGFIGREATLETPQNMLQDGQARWSYEVPEGATVTALVIKDADGTVVARLDGETGAGRKDFVWDGRADGGAPLPDGVYTLEVSVTGEDGDAAPARVFATSRVTGVDLSGSEVIIEMGAVRAPLSSVQSLREAPVT
ncbi:MAG: hypothetical protein KIS81_00010 [Maricaulaceae bacterium]|nr:hypothetical protein [Maricaulaceae bacterium]